jgi:hypothetical protein
MRAQRLTAKSFSLLMLAGVEQRCGLPQHCIVVCHIRVIGHFPSRTRKAPFFSELHIDQGAVGDLARTSVR